MQAICGVTKFGKNLAEVTIFEKYGQTRGTILSHPHGHYGLEIPMARDMQLLCKH